VKFDPKEVLAEVASGTSFVCAMCIKYWKGKDLRNRKNWPDFLRWNQLCSAEKPCGSPFAGDVFSEYEGPLTSLERICFVCGKDSEYGVRVRNLVRVIGICEKHKNWFKHFYPNFKEKLKPINFKAREILK